MPPSLIFNQGKRVLIYVNKNFYIYLIINYLRFFFDHGKETVVKFFVMYLDICLRTVKNHVDAKL